MAFPILCADERLAEPEPRPSPAFGSAGRGRGA